MSETTLLGVGHEYMPLPGCTEGESRVCHRLVQTLVRSGAGVFAGAKPASLFSFDLCACERCCSSCLGQGAVAQVTEDALRALGRTLQGFGYGLAVIGPVTSRVMLLLYRDSCVEDLLRDASKRAFLAYRGYDTSGAAELVGCFVERLERYYAARLGTQASGRLRSAQARDACLRLVGGDAVPRTRSAQQHSVAEKCARPERQPWMGQSEFPHEIGLLFGYPLEDVEGFMSKANPTCRGPWVAYGDVRQAQCNFDELLQAEAACRKRFASGISFGEFAQASVA